VSNLYHISLLYPVEPCAPSCTSSLNQPVSIGIPYTASHRIVMSTLTLLSFTLVVASHALVALSFADPPASRPGRSFLSSADSPSIQHAHSHSVPHLVTLPFLTPGLFRYPFICLVSIHTPPVSRRNIHIPSPAIRT
jgi:hypothetical protein